MFPCSSWTASLWRQLLSSFTAIHMGRRAGTGSRLPTRMMSNWKTSWVHNLQTIWPHQNQWNTNHSFSVSLSLLWAAGRLSSQPGGDEEHGAGWDGEPMVFFEACISKLQNGPGLNPHWLREAVPSTACNTTGGDAGPWQWHSVCYPSLEQLSGLARTGSRFSSCKLLALPGKQCIRSEIHSAWLGEGQATAAEPTKK